MNVRQWINVATCVAYVGAAAWMLDGPAEIVFGGWMIVLGVTSAWHHWSEWSLRALRADHFGMYGTFVALVLYGASDHKLIWVAMLGLGILIGWLYAFQPDRWYIADMTVLEPMMIVLGMIAVVSALLAGAYWESIVALAALGLGWWSWHQERDWGHGLWHVCTAVAILLLFAGVR